MTGFEKATASIAFFWLGQLCTWLIYRKDRAKLKAIRRYKDSL